LFTVRKGEGVLLVVDEAVETLRGLGLTLNEARIYLALLQYGVPSAKMVSEVSGVTRQDVYRVMPKLQKKGLVARILTTPAKFKATPIEDGVSILMEKRRKRTKELQQKTAVLVKSLVKHKKFRREEPDFVVVPAKEAFLKRKELAIEAERCVDIIASRRQFWAALSSYGDVVLKGSERGVSFRVVTEKPDDEEELPKIWQKLKGHPHLEVRYLPASPRALVTIYDRKEVLFSISAASTLEDTCLWSNNAGLLAVVQDYFEIMWITAMQTSRYSTDEEQS
jgi:sugar-specific transcriptional regulator TrmB